jgi:hypothetical protein
MILQILQNLQHIVTQLFSFFKVTGLGTSVGRPRKISDRDALSYALYQHASTRATKKSVYEDLKETLACSYKTFVVSVNRVAPLALRILSIIMAVNKRESHIVKYTDATDIPVCLKKNMDEHKTMAGLAGLGRSTKGWFYGLKMTLTRDHKGRMLGLKFT